MAVSRSFLTATERLNFKLIPVWVLCIVESLLEEHFQVYLVGGAVRDLLWGELPQDWDLASDALPEQVAEIFPGTVPIGKRFGTVLIINSQNSLELTTIREDLSYSDGRHPDGVRFGQDILLDLARRDFTINAMAYDFSSRELIDPYQGRLDIRNRRLRCVGEPRVRFQEDGLRMFRYYRFLATLNLTGNRQTERAMDPVWARGVSCERIREEFTKLVLGDQVRLGLKGLKKSGLGNIFLPELFNRDRDPTPDTQKLWEHLLRTVENIQPRIELRLAALLHDIAKPLTRIETQTGTHFYGHDEQGAVMAGQILERLRYPAHIVDTVVILIRWHMFSFDSQSGDGAIRRLILKVGPENIPGLLELRRADIVATDRINHQTWEYWRDLSQRILGIHQQEFIISQFALKLTGRELMDHFKLQPGPMIGEILAFLKEIIIENPALNQKAYLLELAQNYLRRKENSINNESP